MGGAGWRFFRTTPTLLVYRHGRDRWGLHTIGVPQFVSVAKLPKAVDEASAGNAAAGAVSKELVESEGKAMWRNTQRRSRIDYGPPSHNSCRDNVAWV